MNNPLLPFILVPLVTKILMAIRVLLSNIASLSKHVDELKNLLDVFEPSIVGLNETKLKKVSDSHADISTHSIAYDNNCHILKADKTGPNDPPISGTSVFSNSNSQKIVFSTSPGVFELIVCDTTINSHKVRFIFGYLSPSSNNDFVDRFFVEIVEHVNICCSDTFVHFGGDFNAKDSRIFPSSTPNYAGKVLFNLMNCLPLYQHGPTSKIGFTNNVNYPTRTSSKGRTNLLDVFMTSYNCNYQVRIDHIDAISDHDILMIYLNEQSSDWDDVGLKSMDIYRYDEADIDVLANSIKDLTNQLKSDIAHETIDLYKDHRHFVKDWKAIISKRNKNIAKKNTNFNDYCNKKFEIQKLDLLVPELERNLLKVYKDTVPHKTMTVKDNENSSAIFPTHLQELYQQKSHLYNQLRKNGANPKSDITYKKVSENCANEHAKFMNRWHGTLNSAGRSQSRNFYGQVKLLLGRSATKKAVIVRDKKGVLGNAKESAQIISEHFSKKLNHNAKTTTVNKKFKYAKISEKAEPFQADFNSVKDILTNLNNKLSCGFDQINNRLLKLCKNSTAELITLLSSQIFKLNYWPKAFKTANAIVLHKKNDRQDCDNYRVIALLSCISKVIEKSINKQIIDHFDRNKLFYFRQAGYRTQNSTDDITADLLDEILIDKAEKFLQSILFVDFKGAFDYMSIERLIIKLRGYGLLESQVQMINSYLTGRSFVFTVNGHRSSKCELLSGCSQGSALGPLLFLIFINDIPALVKTAENDFIFADDVGAKNKAKSDRDLIVKTKRTIKRVNDWSNKNQMIISKTKTELMFIGSGNFGNFYLDGQQIKVVDNFRYLGNFIDNKLTGKIHLEKYTSKVEKSLGLCNQLKNQTSLEKIAQICQTWTYPLVSQGWKPMLPLMNNGLITKWESLSKKVQKLSLNAPIYANREAVSKISVIPTLSDSVKRGVSRECTKILLGKENSLTAKIQPSQPAEKRRKIHINPSHPKSAVTMLSNHINDCNLKTIQDWANLHKNNRPKLALQTINTKMCPADRKIIRNLSLGCLSREKMNACNNRISKYCTRCIRMHKSRNSIENTIHLISCSSFGEKLNEFTQLHIDAMVSLIEKRQKTTKFKRTADLCDQFLNWKVYNDQIDFCLGIGKIQMLKELSIKLYRKLIHKIEDLQPRIIDILREKGRLSLSFYRREEYLLDDQTNFPAYLISN